MIVHAAFLNQVRHQVDVCAVERRVAGSGIRGPELQDGLDRGHHAAARFASMVKTIGPGPFRDRMLDLHRQIADLVDRLEPLADHAVAADRALAVTQPDVITAELKTARRELARQVHPTRAQMDRVSSLHRQFEMIHRVWDERDHDYRMMSLAVTRIEEVVAQGTVLIMDPTHRERPTEILGHIDGISTEINSLRLAFEELERAESMVTDPTMPTEASN